ncbi:MAG TPA: hypothetical protein VHF91_06725 [Acidimicrobiales bacterium]|nr:hypothetical protein [Acidimicrobiales bacterium]
MDDVGDRLRDSLYTAVGFGVLGFQQAQVRRRQLQKELARLAIEVDEKVDPVLDDLEARLADDLRPLLISARSAARSARDSLLGPPPRTRRDVGTP